MRLINTLTGQSVDKDPEETRYAILSHTWDKKGEQTYERLKKIQERYPPPKKVPESGPGVSKAGASSSSGQPEGGLPPTHLPSSTLPSDLVSVNSGTPLTASFKPTKSWFTRRLVQLKTLFRSALRSPSQVHSPSVTTCPAIPTALGHPPRSEVEVLVPAVDEASGLAPAIPASTSSDRSSVSSDRSSSLYVHQSDQSLNPIWDDPELSPKIKNACAVARKNGYRYIWIDSCCIDKSSSSELSEAINSMYKWYSLAEVCYAYLTDVPLGDDHHAENSRFRKSRWFTRGWTLQELIAPVNVEFLSQDWTPIELKHALHDLVESITGISHRALLHMEPLSSFSVAQRLAWATSRNTTRKEDMAYSLLGTFDINMPTLYGEGDRAFRRLQEQIMLHIPDQSLFAWGEVYLPDSSHRFFDGDYYHYYYDDDDDDDDDDEVENQTLDSNSITLELVEYPWGQSLSADTHYYFKDSRNIQNIELPASLHHKIGYSSTPYGIRTQFQMTPLSSDLLSRILLSGEVELKLPDDSNQWYLAILGCEHMECPGHLLGRLCYIPPSKSGVEFVCAGYIRRSLSGGSELFPLSPDTIEDIRPHIELKTVYIPHPNPADQLQSLSEQAYRTIELVLLMETRDALRSRGYRADLRGPDSDHPTTHWLTLSNDEHTITVEFQHTLWDRGNTLTIDATVKTSGSGVQSNSAMDSDQADRHTVSWSDRPSWETRLGPERVRLSAAGHETLTVALSLDFGGLGFYFVNVDVRSDMPPAPADVDSALPASPAGEKAGEKAKEVEVTGDESPSGVVDTEDLEAGWEMDAGGRGMASVDEGRVEEVAGETAEGGEGGGSA